MFSNLPQGPLIFHLPPPFTLHIYTTCLLLKAFEFMLLEQKLHFLSGNNIWILCYLEQISLLIQNTLWFTQKECCSICSPTLCSFIYNNIKEILIITFIICLSTQPYCQIPQEKSSTNFYKHTVHQGAKLGKNLLQKWSLFYRWQSTFKLVKHIQWHRFCKEQYHK